MPTHPMLDQLAQLGLLTHPDWLALLVDRELTHRRDKRLALCQTAPVGQRRGRRLPGSAWPRPLFRKLTNGEWIDAHDKDWRGLGKSGTAFDSSRPSPARLRISFHTSRQSPEPCTATAATTVGHPLLVEPSQGFWFPVGAFHFNVNEPAGTIELLPQTAMSSVERSLIITL